MKLCGIYKIENKINGNVYIGKSIDILHRWEQHIDAARLETSDYLLYKELKDNYTNFSFEIVELCKEENLQEREQFYINYYESLSNGYNQVNALDTTKKEALMLKQDVLDTIKYLEETNMLYSDISKITGLSRQSVENINRCKSYKSYHGYDKNIREECGRKQYYDKGELNPGHKLTEAQVKEIIKLLETSTLTYTEIGQLYNVAKTTIQNINNCTHWRYLTEKYNNNIRKEYKKIERRVKVK